MTQYLAIPAWMTPPRPLSDWLEGLATLGYVPAVNPAFQDGCRFDITELAIEAYAELDEEFVSAIDFAIAEGDPAQALAVLRTLAQTLGWELHSCDENDGND